MFKINSQLALITKLPLLVVVCVSQFALAYSQSIDVSNPIASQYPGDQGIKADQRVVFAEDFEDEFSEIEPRWNTVRNKEVISLSDEVSDSSSGKQSLLMSQVHEKGTGADLYRVLKGGHDRLFTRMMVRIAEDCEPIHHFGTCVGGNNPATPWPSVKAGQPTDGSKAFWFGIEPFGSMWRWDYYAYWCEMRGSPPRGNTWGNSFIHDDSLAVERGKWTCIESMIKLNDVGQSNGELALWIDGRNVSHIGPGFPRGKWIFDKFMPGKDGEGVKWNHDIGDRENFMTADGGDPFEGFRFRTDDQLKINFVWLYTYITKGSPGHTNRVWYDDVVVATEYIGPIRLAK
jgi:hypothetical protein